MPILKLPLLPSNPLQKLRDIVKEGHRGVEKARNGIRSIANELRGGILPEAPKKPGETKSEEEECPVCSELTDLKEFIGKRRVKRALSELEKSGDKESVETVKKYIEGDDLV